MCFDITAGNTVNKAGARALLQQKLKQKLINLACRHHAHELIVPTVSVMLIEFSSGPKIKLFVRFSKVCYDIDVSSYDSGMKEKSVAAELGPMTVDLLVLLCHQVKVYNPRDDYKKLLQLAILFRGEKPWEAVHINAPGAYHRARWMTKLIYAFKSICFVINFICRILKYLDFNSSTYLL